MVIPGILEEDFEGISEKIEICQLFSDHIHIDFIDESFGRSTFLDSSLFSKYSKSNFLEAHLMVSDPIKYLNGLSLAGFKRFIGHIEHMPDQVEFVAKGQSLGEVGLAIDGKTDVSEIKVDLNDLDLILVMTIDAGASGRPFNEKYLEKVKQLKQNFSNIEVDGGINDQTILKAKEVGATSFVSTSFIFNSEIPSEAYQILTERVRG